MPASRLEIPVSGEAWRITVESANCYSGSRTRRIKSSLNLPVGRFRASNKSAGKRCRGGRFRHERPAIRRDLENSALLRPTYYLAGTGGIIPAQVDSPSALLRFL